jgi:hypothetical protein
MKNEKYIYLRCDCHAETAVFRKCDWLDGDVDYEISIEDGYCGGDYMGIKGRFKRAWKAFWAKPVYYNSVYCEDPERMRKFLEDCLKSMDEE